jgi:hypothetical protein
MGHFFDFSISAHETLGPTKKTTFLEVYQLAGVFCRLSTMAHLTIRQTATSFRLST